MKFPPEGMPIYHLDDRQFAYGYASGLIYFYGMWTKMKAEEIVFIIYQNKFRRKQRFKLRNQLLLSYQYA